MIEQGHLKCYDLVLTTRSPLFVGCGKVYPQFSYLYNPRAQKVSIINEDALVRLIAEKGKVDRYEQFVLGGERNLYHFLHNVCGLDQSEIDGVCRYSVNTEDALDENHSLKEIHAFVRNAAGQVYVPGSSVKGALRTVLLQEMILHDEKRLPLGERDKIPEEQYLNTLRCKPRFQDAVNSIMRGIMVSDSQPIPDDAMMLAKKIDAGIQGNCHSVPLCRECISPGTQICLKITLDQSVLKGEITAESLLASIQAYNRYYRRTYEAKFRAPLDAMTDPHTLCLILGGGTGYFSKTVVYPYFGEEQGVKTASQILSRSFKKHRHENDVEYGISPRTMKYARYRRQLFPYGLCEVSLT